MGRHEQMEQDRQPQKMELRRSHKQKQQMPEMAPVLLEEVEVRPGEAECFCFKCIMEPGTGISLFSLTEAWGGARHSAKRKKLASRQAAPRTRPAGDMPPSPNNVSSRRAHYDTSNAELVV